MSRSPNPHIPPGLAFVGLTLPRVPRPQDKDILRSPGGGDLTPKGISESGTLESKTIARSNAPAQKALEYLDHLEYCAMEMGKPAYQYVRGQVKELLNKYGRDIRQQPLERQADFYAETVALIAPINDIMELRILANAKNELGQTLEGNLSKIRSSLSIWAMFKELPRRIEDPFFGANPTERAEKIRAQLSSIGFSPSNKHLEEALTFCCQNKRDS